MDYQDVEDPIHQWFELTYASYLVLPRSILQSMPKEWQARMVACLTELEKVYGSVPEHGTYHVYLKDIRGRFLTDFFRDYDRGRRYVPSKEFRKDMKVLRGRENMLSDEGR